jgi:nucleic acid/nucleotide deaminase of polymorphic system toxin
MPPWPEPAIVLRYGVRRASRSFHWKPKVHAELAMIIVMVKGEIEPIVPYISVSKLSCIICSHFIRAFHDVTKQKIATKGSHRKAYPAWFWPDLPSHDAELRPIFLRCIRQQLVSDFERHAKGQLSDGSLGSVFLGLELGLTLDKIFDRIKASVRTAESE